MFPEAKFVAVSQKRYQHYYQQPAQLLFLLTLEVIALCSKPQVCPLHFTAMSRPESVPNSGGDLFEMAKDGATVPADSAKPRTIVEGKNG